MNRTSLNALVDLLALLSFIPSLVSGTVLWISRKEGTGAASTRLPCSRSWAWHGPRGRTCISGAALF